MRGADYEGIAKLWAATSAAADSGTLTRETWEKHLHKERDLLGGVDGLEAIVQLGNDLGFVALHSHA